MKFSKPLVLSSLLLSDLACVTDVEDFENEVCPVEENADRDVPIGESLDIGPIYDASELEVCEDVELEEEDEVVKYAKDFFEYRDRLFGVIKPVDALISLNADVTVEYRLLVQEGLEEHAAEFRQEVTKILGDEFGWKQAGANLVHVEHPRNDEYNIGITIFLGKQDDMQELCSPENVGTKLSCTLSRHPIINVYRWQNPPKTWGNDLDGYREYLINHEVGHALRMKHTKPEEDCLYAPVMVQQTKTLKNCRHPWGWPNEAEIESLSRHYKRFKRSSRR